MKNTRTKKMVTYALDRNVLKDMEAWIAAQTVPPTKTAVVEIAIRDFVNAKQVQA